MLSCTLYRLKYLLILPISMLVSKEHVFAWNNDENYTYLLPSENVVCSDSFENTQCQFIEKAMKVVINRFEQKVEQDKLHYAQERIDLSEQIIKLADENKEMKHKMNKLETQMIKMILKERKEENTYQNIYSHQSLHKNLNDVDSLHLQYFNVDGGWDQPQYMTAKNMLNLTTVSLYMKYLYFYRSDINIF